MRSRHRRCAVGAAVLTCAPPIWAPGLARRVRVLVAGTRLEIAVAVVEGHLRLFRVAAVAFLAGPLGRARLALLAVRIRGRLRLGLVLVLAFTIDIGRASRRERVCTDVEITVGAGTLNKKQ